MLTLSQTRKPHIFKMVGMSATGAKEDIAFWGIVQHICFHD